MEAAVTDLVSQIHGHGDFLANKDSATQITVTDATADDAGISASNLVITDFGSGDVKKDKLFGGDGDDTLYAGGALAELTGGSGIDTFVMTAVSGANDFTKIMDIESGDIIQTTVGNSFSSEEFELAGATLSDYVNEAIKTSDADETQWFNLAVDGTDYTFIVDNQSNDATQFQSGTDSVIAIVNRGQTTINSP